MFDQTVAAGVIALTKISSDNDGTVFIRTDEGLNPTTMTIRHSFPANGKRGTSQHNIKMRVPLGEADLSGVLTGGEAATINFTINHPSPLVDSATIGRAVKLLALFLLNDTDASVTGPASDHVQKLLLNSQ